jgi:hypothetical protein
MLFGTSHWDGYTVFSVISGVLLVLMALVPGLKPGARLLYVLGGAGLMAYGIWVAHQTSGTYYFSVYIFLIPVVALVTFIKAMGGSGTQRPRTPGQPVRPVTHQTAANRPVHHPTAASRPVTNPPTVDPVATNPTTVNPIATNAVSSQAPMRAPDSGWATPPIAPTPQYPMQSSPASTPAAQTPPTDTPGMPPLQRTLPDQKIVISLSDLGDE